MGILSKAKASARKAARDPNVQRKVKSKLRGTQGKGKKI